MQRQRARSRDGSVLLETLLVIPILLIGVLAIVQFSTLTSRMSWVKRASRDGADIASTLTLPTGGTVPPAVIDAVTAALDEKAIAWTEIRLEHNVGPGGPYVLTAGGGGSCTAPANVPSTQYVAVTVCVEESQLAPNLLETFCFDLDGRFVQQTTIRCY